MLKWCTHHKSDSSYSIQSLSDFEQFWEKKEKIRVFLCVCFLKIWNTKISQVSYKTILSRSSVLYTNPWDSIVTLIKISWGICWFTLYLSNLCNSLLHQTITMAFFIRKLIYLKVCCCAATSHHVGWTAELIYFLN